MFFRLIMPSADRLMEGGIIAKWHKAEGEHIGYGADLCDVRIELPMGTAPGSLDEKIAFMGGGGTRAVRPADARVEKTMVLVARVTSSDIGILRRIEAREGSYGRVGSLLAILSTEDDETTPILEGKSSQVSEFRVVANLVV